MLSRTPDETKQGLMCLMREEELDDTCGGCAYLDTPGLCAEHILPDALALIQQLEADNSRQLDVINKLTELLNAAHDETAKMKAERDAAIKDMTELALYIIDDVCEWCDKANCASCISGLNFNWRGVQKEEQPNL